MLNLTHVKQDRAASFDALQALGKTMETRALTADELKAFDEHEAKVKELDATIERGERALKMSGATADPEARRVPAQVHDNRQDEPFRSFGEQLMAVASAGRRGNAYTDPRLLGIEERAGTGLNEGVPADGGFLVQTDFSTKIMERVDQTGKLFSRIPRLPLSGNANALELPAIDEASRADGSRQGGVRGYWRDEGVAPTASRPKFSTVRLTLNKVTAAVYATDELLQDASVLGPWIMRNVPRELVFKVEDALVNGDGAGKPLGVLNAPALVTVAAEAGQAADTVVYENLVKMWSRMYADSRANAAWFINQDVEPQLYTLGLQVGVGGSPVFMPAGGASAAPYSTLFGRPIIPVEYCATVGDVGDVLLVDFGEFGAVEKGGIQSASSIHVQFLAGEQVFRFSYRYDAKPMWKSALAPFKGAANTVSPMVALAAR